MEINIENRVWIKHVKDIKQLKKIIVILILKLCFIYGNNKQTIP